MTKGIVRVAAAIIVLAGVSACGAQSSAPKTPQSVYLASFNEQAHELSAPSAKPGSSFEKQVIGYGHDFCKVFAKDDDDKAAMSAIELTDGIPTDLARAVFIAATDKGSLCPVS